MLKRLWVSKRAMNLNFKSVVHVWTMAIHWYIKSDSFQAYYDIRKYCSISHKNVNLHRKPTISVSFPFIIGPQTNKMYQNINLKNSIKSIFDQFIWLWTSKLCRAINSPLFGLHIHQKCHMNYFCWISVIHNTLNVSLLWTNKNTYFIGISTLFWWSLCISFPILCCW